MEFETDQTSIFSIYTMHILVRFCRSRVSYMYDVHTHVWISGIPIVYRLDRCHMGSWPRELRHAGLPKAQTDAAAASP